MSSENKKITRFIFLTKDSLNQFAKKIVKDYDELTSRQFLDLLKNDVLFDENDDLKGVVYRDPHYTFYLPLSTKLFHIFPQIQNEISSKATPVNNEGEGALQFYPLDTSVISFIGSKSPIYKKITFKIENFNKQSEPVVISIPFSPNEEEGDILKSILDTIGNETFEKYFTDLSNKMGIPFEHLLLHYNCNQKSQVFIPFTKITDFLRLLFVDGVFCPSGELTYEVYSSFYVPRQNLTNHNETYKSKISEFPSQLFDALMLVRPSKFIFTILKLLRGIFKAYPEDPLHNGFAGIKDDISFVMTQRLLNFFSNYFVVDQSTTYKWGTISKVINTNNIRNPTVLQDSYFEVTIASCLACWKTFPSDIVDRFLFTLNSFQSHGKPQNPTYFGTVVYSHYVSVNGLRCTLILTRGFLHLMNFAPKKSDTHEIIPESYGFICSNTKPLFFGAPINSIRFTQFRPKSTIGIVSSPKGYFAVDFLQIEALTDFWLMFIITQLEQSLPFIEPPFPDLRFQISFAHDPVFGSLFCSNVKAGDNKWIISMPFSKFTQKIVKIFKRCSKLQTLIPLDAPLPEINECLKSENSVKFLNREYTYLNIAQASKPPSYDDFNVLQCEYMHSACMELAYTRNQNDQFKFFKILGITDFNRSFVNHSLSLFQYQAKNFPSMISACRIQASPLLHFASLFFDDLKMLKMVTDNFDINDTDDDHRTALFYAIRNPSLCVIQNLFEHKIDADKGDYTSETPLISSFENGYSDISEFLIQQGASINRTHLEFHEPSLFYALQNRKSKTFKKLLKHCKTSDLNCPNSKGQFLTHVCIETRQCKPLFLLSAACADIDPNNYTDKYQHPLHYFLDCKLTKEVKLFRALLSLPNLDLNVYDRHGQTPLCRCISMKAAKLLPLLVSDPRCDLDMQNSKGISPLSIAVKKKSLKAVTCLLKGGVLANAPNDDKMHETPLMIAVKQKNKSIVSKLIEFGADPQRWYNAEGMMPADAADEEIEKLLKSE